MTTTNLFGPKVTAAFFAFLLSATMVLGAVGPAYNGTAQHTQDMIA
jgi:hypothetical protein